MRSCIEGQLRHVTDFAKLLLKRSSVIEDERTRQAFRSSRRESKCPGQLKGWERHLALHGAVRQPLPLATSGQFRPGLTPHATPTLEKLPLDDILQSNTKLPGNRPRKMNNFGVIELAGPKTTATPGWAYVADAAPVQQAASTGRKRAAARGHGLSLSDQSAREEARVRKELEGLDREGNRDVVIPVPANGRGEVLPFLSPVQTCWEAPLAYPADWAALTCYVSGQYKGSIRRT